jgi:hypothetical protein
VCAVGTVRDGTGSFTAAVVARKNPTVREAFPALRNPVRASRQLSYLLAPCLREISAEHRALQEQRLLLDGSTPVFCIDDFTAPDFVDRLAATLSQRIATERLGLEDMVLTLALHHDDASGQLTSAVEAALLKVLPGERDKSSPRVSGAFVFDSFAHRLAQPELKPLVLWCPARSFDGEDLNGESASERDCPLQPDIPNLRLGPLRFSALPILATRRQYLTFLERYSPEQAGRVRTLTFLSPERSTLSQNVSIDAPGLVTRFNNETVSAAFEDAFSFCPSVDASVARVVVGVVGTPGAFPLNSLPALHDAVRAPLYSLGLAWESPFLLAEYEAQVAGAIALAGFTVPFGVGRNDEAFLGAALWKQERFPLGEALAQCTRFCDHPTFDSAGVYQPLSPFRSTYLQQCYRPLFPTPDAGGFPIDP